MATNCYQASCENTKSSLVKRDASFVWHPFTQAKTAFAPLPIKRARGVYLYTEEGTPYLDAISSWWVNLHGHAHPAICERISLQAKELEHVIFADFTHAPAVDLAERVLALLPGEMHRLFYSDNGSTAVEVALKMALQYWHNKKNPKNKIVCFKDSYHGDTFGTMSAAGKNPFNRPFWSYMFDVIPIDPPVKGNEERSLQELEAIIKEGDVACFIFEPLVLGAGGMIIYPAAGLSALLEKCQEYEVLTIADEVMTGFGRTNTLFACEILTTKPDLMCLSKGITGGFLPLGATACSEKLFSTFLNDDLHKAFLHGHSFTGNPLACAAGLASLDLLLEQSCFKQRQMIANAHRDFCEKVANHHKLKRAECLGTLLALEYRAKEASYFGPLRNALYHHFLAKGILLRPLGNVVYVLPPYCITYEELQQIYAAIYETLSGENFL